MPGSHLEGPDLENANLTVIPAPVLIRENECGSESTALKLMTVFNKIKIYGLVELLVWIRNTVENTGTVLYYPVLQSRVFTSAGNMVLLLFQLLCTGVL